MSTQNIYAAKLGASSAVGSFTVDNKGNFKSVCDDMLAILGEKNLDFIGKKSIANYLAAEEMNGHLGRLMIFVTVGALHDQPMTIVSVDGDRKHIILSATVVYNESGDFAYGEGTVRVKERDQISLAWEGRQRARIMTNDLVGVLALKDQQVVWSAPGLKQVFGYDSEELMGQYSRMLYLDEQQLKRISDASIDVLARGETYRTQVQMRKKDGSISWFDIQGKDVGGGVSAWVFLDVNDLRHQIIASARQGYAKVVRFIKGKDLSVAPVSRISYLQAQQGYTRVVLEDQEGLLRQSFASLMSTLDSEIFLQIHRSYLVNVEHIEAIARDDLGRMVISLRGRTEQLIVSRPFESQFSGDGFM